MSRWQLIVRSLKYHWPIHLAVALGVAAATAVMTGALVVGDSVRGSLAHLALDRLGQIDDVLVVDRFFRSELVDELIAAPDFKAHYAEALPAILVEGSVKNLNPKHPGRAGDVTIIGCSEFGKLGANGPSVPIEPGEVVLNESLASQIDAEVGDEILLRIGRMDQIPADSPLGRKTETVRTRRLRVSKIIPTEGLGRFGLRPTQQLPNNAFVAAETLAAMLDQRGKANAIFVAGNDADDHALDAELKPQLVDYGLALEKTKQGYWQLTSSRLLIDRAAVKAVIADLAADHLQPVFTYLANTIRVGNREIPYSTVSAIDFSAELPMGPFESPDGKTLPSLRDDEIALNDWAADDLGAKVGDEVELVYFEPESTHGEVREKTAKFRLKAIVALRGAAADRNLTPELAGVTDQTSIGDWDPPFPFQASRVRKKDEKYWDDYRATPKAFVSLATGRKLWASRFGDTTSIRLAADDSTTAEQLQSQLKLDPADFGFRFLPVKRQALQAASGTTPFGVLFIGFSFFIIIAAVMLVALLFQLGLEQRGAELGVMQAVGIRARRAVGLFATEGLLVAAIGSLVGVAAGVGYAWLMLAGLRTWWLGAVSTPFLTLYVTPMSLVLGYLIGILVTGATIYWTAWRMQKISTRQLLAGEASATPAIARRDYCWTKRIGWIVVLLATGIGFAATRAGGEAAAGAFFTSGLLVLVALLLLVFVKLRSVAFVSSSGVARALGQLAARNGARHPVRSTLSIGLVAVASFLIVATSAFRLDPLAEARGRFGGTGGFALVAQSDQPIYQDLNSRNGRSEIGFGQVAEKELNDTHTIGLRVRAGDDASCLNLYQPTQPRVLGVPESLIERGGFAWAASAAQTPEERDNPWLLLDRPLPPDADGMRPVPVVMDLNTAMYSLHLWKGIGEEYDITDGQGNKVRLKVVGLLKNSIFQGDLLIGERQFLTLFPGVSGYRLFLIDTAPHQVADARGALEETLEDYGFDAQPTIDRLAGFMAVQNTYLSTFQSLGGLGLLLGTFGLATVQLRSVVERRGELALMQAIGFRRRRLAKMVILENAILLLAGLGVGVLAALVAILPHLFGSAAGIPWATTALTLIVILVVGLLASLIAVRTVLRADLLPALRIE